MKLYNNDCLEILKTLPNKSIDLILTDLPYARTKNSWDIAIDKSFWLEYERILTDIGNVVLTSMQPYTSILILDCSQMCKRLVFRYETIWEKSIGSGQLNINHQPLRVHENILIFSKQRATYNPQKSIGSKYTITRNLKQYENRNYNDQKTHTSINEGFRHPKTILKFSNPRIKKGHPTQKPVALMEYLIKTYSNEEDVVLDNCMGSGTTGVACQNTNRNFIGIEKEKKYFNIAVERLKQNKQEMIDGKLKNEIKEEKKSKKATKKD